MPRSPRSCREGTRAAGAAFALLYLVAMGAFFAAFVAVEFEAVGNGGAAATRCMPLVCVSNVSSDLMAPLDGRLHDRFGITVAGMAGRRRRSRWPTTAAAAS